MAAAKDIIRHSFCQHPHCYICRSNEALLCNELVGPDGTRYITTKRERDIAKIIKDFFYTKYRLQIMDKEKLSTVPKRSSPWFLSDLAYQLYTANTRGWSYNIHSFSRTYEGKIAVVELSKLALYHDVYDSYKQFLKDNNLHSFMPADLESVD